MRWLPPLVGVVMLACGSPADANAYRCDDGGRITYTNLPCPSGRQTELLDRPSTPTAADRAAAASRLRADQARLDDIARQRERERRQDRQAATLAARRDTDRGKQASACTKLALRAKRAHEDYDGAGSRDRSAKRTRMQRADDDYAALCRKR